MNSIKQNTEDVLDASKEVGVEVNTQKTEVNVHVSSPDYWTKPLLYNGR
jgi:hypothetical protein